MRQEKNWLEIIEWNERNKIACFYKLFYIVHYVKFTLHDVILSKLS